MANYDLYVFCNECSDVHPMGVRIVREDGPTDKTSIGDLFAGEEMPADIATFIKNTTMCPNTSRTFVQEDNNQIFLVPMSE